MNFFIHFKTIKLIAKKSIFTGAISVFMLLSMTGCATGPNANPADPFEPFNRGVASFNDGLDNAVLKPVATAYRNVTPTPVRTGVSNVVNNLRDVWSTVNTALQLRPQATVENTMRVAMNTVLGLGGLLDIASEAGIERHQEDFGTTLGRWGVGAGPYVVMPLFGPSTLRDTAAFPINNYGDPLSHVSHVPTRNSANVLRLVDTRANFLRAGNLLDEVALDKYSFVRDAHLQRRAASIYGYKDKAEDPYPADKVPVDKK